MTMLASPAVEETLVVWLILWAHGAFCGFGLGAHVLDLWFTPKSLARCATCAHESKCCCADSQTERST